MYSVSFTEISALMVYNGGTAYDKVANTFSFNGTSKISVKPRT